MRSLGERLEDSGREDGAKGNRTSQLPVHAREHTSPRPGGEWPSERIRCPLCVEQVAGLGCHKQHQVNSEQGKVSAVLGALDGIMPMISFSLYTAVYHSTVEVFPGAQFFFGASANVLMALVFIFVMATDKTGAYNVEAPPKPRKEPVAAVTEKRLVMHQDSSWLYEDTGHSKLKIRLSTILLSSVNFSIEYYYTNFTSHHHPTPISFLITAPDPLDPSITHAPPSPGARACDVAAQKVPLDTRDGVKHENHDRHKRDLRGRWALLPLEAYPGSCGGGTRGPPEPWH
ncbi:hypothetical protein C7M84_006206 [Penaeus vannamei]|uniref:Uncharacterized protein n=1 Tax=Penaeus vannamei TaxID=6689 RepID=A0A3R7QDI5_PENVA|nr:hypothetical protein C7M84_006206 [Penaeus vannamei]